MIVCPGSATRGKRSKQSEKKSPAHDLGRGFLKGPSLTLLLTADAPAPALFFPLSDREVASYAPRTQTVLRVGSRWGEAGKVLGGPLEQSASRIP
jgi:hypothetical protein